TEAAEGCGISARVRLRSDPQPPATVDGVERAAQGRKHPGGGQAQFLVSHPSGEVHHCPARTGPLGTTKPRGKGIQESRFVGQETLSDGDVSRSPLASL